VVKETTVKEDIKKDPISIASFDISFTMSSKQNLKDLVCKNQDKYDHIRELEYEIRCGKGNP